ncbi:MAG TPA: glucose-6-phosphate dehydrogenase [Vicinamibacterales bacterium]|nr:glucose-6-phosphate dehydrogenase [Vicinamibacterales bacterium]
MTTAPHPVQSAPTQANQQTPPCVMVIFGGSGDLTKRKLIPALYNLATNNLLRKEFAVVGIARSDMSTDDFRKKIDGDLHEFAPESIDPKIWERLQTAMYYMPGDLGDPARYDQLKAQLAEIDERHGTSGNRLYYLATAPQFFAEIVKQLAHAGLTREEDGTWQRVVIEKPFGRDLESARHLNQELTQVLHERQIFRIDHYLGKETVQNIMAFRFANGIFEPIWNRRYIDHVEITSAEEVGVEQRGGYYEGAGALRDMVPNHLFQLMTLTAMEPPVSFDANAVRDEQTKILKAIQPMSPEEVLTRVVRGQYGEGVIDGTRVPAYRKEPSVDPASNTETFVAMKLLIDNWRWADVAFYLRTGKRLPCRVTEIAIQFKRAPFVLFRDTPVERLSANRLVMHIQPEEGITLRFGAKIPGPHLNLGSVNMDFKYSDYFGATPSTGYERLLYDAMSGDATLFQRGDMVEAAWSVVTPILDVWKALPPRNFPNYGAGTWGPAQADELLKHDKCHWREIPS